MLDMWYSDSRQGWAVGSQGRGTTQPRSQQKGKRGGKGRKGVSDEGMPETEALQIAGSTSWGALSLEGRVA